MLPSFVTAMMTFINIDYKYFSGNASPFNIINKYRYRGFTTILNDKEKKQNINYIVNYTTNKLKIKISNINSVNKVYGLKTLNNLNFYKLSENYYFKNNFFYFL